MACYLVELLQGHNLIARHIKLDTAERYMLAAARVRTRGTPRLHDPRLDETGREFHEISRIKQEQARWETKVNKQNPVSKLMIDHMFIDIDPNTPSALPNALADWHVIGEYTGIRISEWAQPDKHPTYSKRQLSPDGDTLAFQYNDMTFFGPNGSHLQQEPHIPLPDITKIARVRFRWRFQKNGIKGETKSFSRNDHDILHCPVRAALRIRERFNRYKNLPNDHPLSLFQSPNTVTPTLIKASHVTNHLQTIASIVYKTSDNSILQLYTPHSIRVGACVMLHIAKASEKDIKFLLRWRSNSFMEYLRDIPETSHIMIQHVNNVMSCIDNKHT